MIAKNFLQYPEALRFQRELFGGSVKISVRYARLVECIFCFKPNIPQWVKDATARAKALVKIWKAQIIEFNFKDQKPPTGFDD